MKTCLIHRYLPYLKGNRTVLNIHIYPQSYRNLSISQNHNFNWQLPLYKKQESSPEEEVILVDLKGNQSVMQFQHLLEKAGDKNVVKVLQTKKKNEAKQKFKIMTDADLEAALKKQKLESGYQGNKEILETVEGRIKQKIIDISDKISDHDLEYQLKKIKKLLIKGNFISVNISSKDKNSQKYTNLQNKIKDYFSEYEALLGQNSAKLKIK